MTNNKRMNNIQRLLVGSILVLTIAHFANLAPSAYAVEGDLISCLIVDMNGDGAWLSADDQIDGLGVAFDGNLVYFTLFNDPNLYVIDNTDSAVDIPCITAGTDGQLVPLLNTIAVATAAGAGVSCDAIAHDPATGDIICAETATHNVYRVTVPGGVATLMFNAFAGIDSIGCGFGGVNPTAPIPNASQCLTLIDGMTLNPEDGNIFYSPDASIVIFEFNQAGVLQNNFRVDGTPPAGDMAPDCDASVGAGFAYVSGLAATRTSSMYVGANGCTEIFRYNDNTGVKESSFTLQQSRTEDLECDDVTFNALGFDGLWNHDAFDDFIRATEVPINTCSFISPQIGGSFMPIDTTSLYIAGISTSMLWLLPIIVGAFGTSAYFILPRKQIDEVI